MNLVEVIQNEIEDRTHNRNGSYGEGDVEWDEYAVELKALADLKDKVIAQQPLTHSEYVWLTDMVYQAGLLDGEG